MQHISKLTNVKQNLSSASTITSGKATQDDKAFINQLFLELAGIFPAWKQAFDGDEGVRAAKRNWMLGLIDQKITKLEQVEAGLSYARKQTTPFLPSVGQFIEWCKTIEIEPDYVSPRLDNPSKPETVAASLAQMMQTLKR